MARLGELLVAAGLLTVEQVEQALRAQVMWGARLGTNLIELGFVDLDPLSSALGRQHAMPAALARHFAKVDPELQQLLPPTVAELFSCVPLHRVGPQRDVVIATSSPLPAKALAKIAEFLVVEPTQLIPAIAAELRIRYQLEKVYNIYRSSRFKRAPGNTLPPFPGPLRDESLDLDLDLDLEVDGTPVASEPEADVTAPFKAQIPRPASKPRALIVDESEPEPEPEPPPPRAPIRRLETLDELAGVAEPAVQGDPEEDPERRSYIRTIADTPLDSERQLGRIAIRRVAVALDPQDAARATPGEATRALPGASDRVAALDPPATAPATLDEAARAIRRAGDRDRVAELAMDTLLRFAPACHAATLLVLRGGVATSCTGFCRAGTPLPEIAVPLDQPSLVPRAAAQALTLRSPAVGLGPLDQLLIVSLGAQTGELVCVPVSIAGQTMGVIVMVTERDAPMETAEAIATAAGAAFARLMRDAAR